MTPNSYDRASRTLEKLLKDDDQKVIALTGSWGTGKTCLWQRMSSQKFNRTSVYVSLFGVKSTQELKLRLLSAAINGNNVDKGVATILDGLVKKFTGASLSEVGTFGLPQLLKDKLVVFDDLERKNKSLETDEIMGFIDEFSQQYNVSFLLLLNTNRLDDKGLWQTLHEKVIDVEVCLLPQPSEAFDIAKAARNYNFSEIVKTALMILGVTNIRVMRRVLRVIAAIWNVKGSESVIKNWAAVTVLMTCSHFRAVEDLPTLDYIIEYRPYRGLFGKEEMRSPQHQKWDQLIQALDIYRPDNFEILLRDYLLTGHLNDQELQDVFVTYSRAKEGEAADLQFKEFITQALWGTQYDDKELRTLAEELLPGW